MNNIEKKLLEKIVDLHSTPSGAFSIRKNGVLQDKSSTKEIEIIPKKNKSGIDIKIKSGDVSINAINITSHDQIVLETMIIQLQTVESEFKENLKVIRRE